MNRLDATPPQNLEMEQCTLGSILLDPKGEAGTFALVATILQSDPSHFYREAHQRIFRAMLLLTERGEPVDLMMLIEELRSQKLLDAIGGPVTIFNLMDAVPTAANAEYYARNVEEYGRRRKLITGGQRAAEIGYEGGEGWEEAGRNTLEAMGEACPLSLRNDEEEDDHICQLDLFMDIVGRTENLSVAGLTTGFPTLDEYTDGIERGEFWIIAGRPGMGKSAVAAAITQHVAQSEPALLLSLEMGRKQLWRRFYSMRSGVPLKVLKKNALSPEQKFQLAAVKDSIMDWKLRILTPPRLTPVELRRLVRADVEKRGTQLVVIDYLQLMEGRGMSRREEITDISAGIRRVAQEFDVPIIGVSQLTRASEKRPDKRPQLGDLIESGSLEADASVVLGIYREGYYADSKPPGKEPQDLELIILKERDGQQDTVYCQYIAARTWAYQS